MERPYDPVARLHHNFRARLLHSGPAVRRQNRLPVQYTAGSPKSSTPHMRQAGLARSASRARGKIRASVPWSTASGVLNDVTWASSARDCANAGPTVASEAASDSAGQPIALYSFSVNTAQIASIIPAASSKAPTTTYLVVPITFARCRRLIRAAGTSARSQDASNLLGTLAFLMGGQCRKCKGMQSDCQRYCIRLCAMLISDASSTSTNSLRISRNGECIKHDSMRGLSSSQG